MPTDHGPELEALRKRLADAKEFPTWQEGVVGRWQEQRRPNLQTTAGLLRRAWSSGSPPRGTLGRRPGSRDRSKISRR